MSNQHGCLSGRLQVVTDLPEKPTLLVAGPPGGLEARRAAQPGALQRGEAGRLLRDGGEVRVRRRPVSLTAAALPGRQAGGHPGAPSELPRPFLPPSSGCPLALRPADVLLHGPPDPDHLGRGSELVLLLLVGMLTVNRFSINRR